MFKGAKIEYAGNTQKKGGYLMSVSTTIKKYGLTKAFQHLYKDPEKNLREMMDWFEKYLK